MNLRWTNIVTWISTVAALCLAAAAWYQASSNSRQVEALQHQTMISHYAASTAMLGSDEIAVRIGAIQALEHLAQVQPELFHLRVMRLLCAFIRQPVPAKPKPRELRADVQAALDTVIYRSKEGRRIEDQYRRQYTDRRRGGLEPLAPLIIDLSGSDLQWAKLYRAQLKDVILDRVNLSYASGNAAVFAGASFIAAIAHKATFIDANFDSAKMLGGDWSGSVMQNSSFIGTRMPNRLTEAHLEGTNLSQAVFGPVDLTGTSLEKSDLSGAKFGTGTRSTTNSRSGVRSSTKLYPAVTQESLDFAIADPTNPPLLPAGITDVTTGRPLVWKTQERGKAWREHRRMMEETEPQ